MKRIYTYPMSIVLLAGIYLFVLANISGILGFVSPKGFVTERFHKEVEFYLLILFIGISLFITLIFFAKELREYTYKSVDNLSKRKIHIALPSGVIITLLGIYMIVMGIFIINNMDISTDESTYVSTGQNYFSEGKFLYTVDREQKLVPKDMFLQNIFLMPFKSAGEFDVRYLRYITFVFSILLVIGLMKYFVKGKKRLVSMILLASSSGFIYLSSSSFAENIAIVAMIIGLRFFMKYRNELKSYYMILSSIFLALSLLTKLQLGVFIIGALVLLALYNFYKKEEFASYIKIVLYTISFAILFSVTFLLTYFNAYEIKKLIALYYTLVNTSVAKTTGSINIFQNLERFFSGSALIFFSLIIYGIKRKLTGKSEIDKFVILIIVLNAVWYILWKGYNYRFMYYAQMGLIFLSVNPIEYILSKYEGNIKYFAGTVLIMILATGIIQTSKLAMAGNSNQYLIALNGNNPFKTFSKFEKDKSQKDFYDRVKATVNSNEKIFYIGAEFEPTAHIKNPLYVFFPENKELNPDIRFIIRTAINDELGINGIYNDFLKEKCEIVFTIGNYTLYKIK